MKNGALPPTLRPDGSSPLKGTNRMKWLNEKPTEVEVEINGGKKILKAGDAFYIPPNVLHGAVCMEPGVLIDIFSPMREDFIGQ